jgi:hypothetical protein
MTITNKTWKEFNIFVKQYKEPSEEDLHLESLGIPKSSETKDDEDYNLARVCFALEDVSDYFESYNNVKRVKGTCVNLYTGNSYFITTPFEKFRKLREDAKIEGNYVLADKPTMSVVNVEENF